MKSTGEAAPKFGLFFSLCCGHQIAIGQGARFLESPGVKPMVTFKSTTLQRARPRTSPGTIAVVEDVEDNRSVLRALLGEYYEIHEFENGATFLASLDRTNYDLVLLDLSMPEMDGFGVLERVQHHPTQRFVPVIAVTARAMYGDREKALAVGFRDYVTKPFDFDVILSCIRRHLTR